jgi:alkylation response protein AidB-like acyl-CoA dehydrogenase
MLVVIARTSSQQTNPHGISAILLDPKSKGVEIKSYPTVDGFQAADVYFSDVTVTKANLLGQVDDAFSALEKAVDFATFGVCAEAVGMMEMLYKKTVEYTKERKQFGSPLANFQALQHRMADMFIEYEQAKSAVLMAAMELDANNGYAPKAVSAAKSRVGKAARLIGQEAVQLHGGMGVTDELDIGHYFKRLTTIQFTLGSTDFHTQRFALLSRQNPNN